MGWGQIEPEVSGFKSLFWGDAEVANINTCLDEMAEFKGRDTALQKKAYKKKVFKSESA